MSHYFLILQSGSMVDAEGNVITLPEDPEDVAERKEGMKKQAKQVSDMCLKERGR